MSTFTRISRHAAHASSTSHLIANPFWLRAAPDLSARIFASVCSQQGTTSSAWTISSPAPSATSSTSLANPSFELMRHDVTFPLYVEVDQIYNLACPASPIHYQHDPVQTTKTSVHGAINMLGLAKRLQLPDPPGLDQRGLRRPGGPPAGGELLGQRQPDRPARPATTRASAAPRRCSSTITASTASRSRSRASSTPMARACIPNDGRVVSNFIVQALNGEPITIYGDGAQTRSFCYVDDLVDGLHAPDGEPRRLHRPGQSRQSRTSSRSGSWPRLVDRDDGLASRSSVHEPLPQDDPRQRQPDIALAQRAARLAARRCNCARGWSARSAISRRCCWCPASTSARVVKSYN